MPPRLRPDVDVDVLIVGAGLSGIGSACQLSIHSPGTTYRILEAREDLGGTWDLFRYPGLRSDSDMFTYAYGFRPWRGPRAIASGQQIHDYIRETAREYAVTDHISYGHRVVAARWSTAGAHWTVEVEVASGGDCSRTTLTCGYLWVNSGYYRYDHGHTPDIEGMGTFAGTVIHPQQWPEGFDPSGVRIAVIGSGATTVTLVPELTRAGARVTQIQRTPTYVAARPTIDPWARRLAGRIPRRLTQRLVRARYIADNQATYALSRVMPEMLKARLRRRARRRLPADFDVTRAFEPDYRPFEQRICVAADGDLFEMLSAGRSRIITSAIRQVTPDGLELTSGEKVEADVIVTATGLDLLIFGGMTLEVDGRHVDPADTTTFRGVLLSGVPNFAFTLGFTTASWTLRSDLAARYVCRVLNHLRRSGHRIVTPRLPAATAARMRRQPLITYSSSYVQRSRSVLPSQGNRSPWQVGDHYLLALAQMQYGPLQHRDLAFSGGSADTDHG